MGNWGNNILLGTEHLYLPINGLLKIRVNE
jgi:hypothetical protein